MWKIFFDIWHLTFLVKVLFKRSKFHSKTGKEQSAEKMGNWLTAGASFCVSKHRDWSVEVTLNPQPTPGCILQPSLTSDLTEGFRRIAAWGEKKVKVLKVLHYLCWWSKAPVSLGAALTQGILGVPLSRTQLCSVPYRPILEKQKNTITFTLLCFGPLHHNE